MRTCLLKPGFPSTLAVAVAACGLNACSVAGHQLRAVSAAASTDTENVRAALQRQYDEMGRAIATWDVARVRRVFSPLDTAAEDSAAWWEAQFARRRRLELWEISLDTLAVYADTARIGYLEHSVIVSRDSTGASRRHEAFNHEVAWWVRSNGEWLHRNFVRDQLPRAIVDGQAKAPTHSDSAVVIAARAYLRGDRRLSSAPVQDRDAVVVLDLEHRINSAHLHPDAATRAFLDATVADDFVRTGTAGRRLDKRSTVAEWTVPSSERRPVASALRDVRLVLAGDAGYVTSLSIETERRASGDTTVALRVTDVWHKRGQWQLVASHASPVPMPTDPVVPPPVVTRVMTDPGTIDDSAAVAAEYQSHAVRTRAESIARYDSSMTDDFMSARSNGSLSGKQATIARWTPAPPSGGGSNGWSQVGNLSVHTYGGVAVVLLTDTQFDSSGRRTFVVHTTDIRRKEKGRWRLAALQTSPVSADLVSSEDSATFVALEHAVVRASARGDTSTLGRVLDSSFVVTLSSGRRYDKRTAIARWTSPDSSGLHPELSDIAVTTSPDGAVVDMIDSQVDRNGQRVRASRAIDLFARTDSDWRLVASLAWPESAIQQNAETADEVRTARARWNASIVNDPATLAALLSDSVVQSSVGFRRIGRSQYMQRRARILGERPDLSLRYAPGRVVAARDVALESGEWREGWREGNAPVNLSGTYHALWRRTGGSWTIVAELLLPMRCSQESYCRD